MINNAILNLPRIGFGTSEFSSKDEVVSCVTSALEVGYRLFDTASIYGSEEGIGVAINSFIKKTNTARNEIIISSKISNEDQGYLSTKIAVNKSLNVMQQDYIDLFLIHWPIPRNHEKDYKELNLETWRALIEMKKAGFIREIGVCNFLPRHIENLENNTGKKPFINQLEIHPKFQQNDVVRYCREKEILIEAWCPFRHGKIFEEPVLQDMAQKYDVSVSDFCLNWDIQKGIIPLPKSRKTTRIKENYNILSHLFTISDKDMEVLETMDDPNGHEDYWNYRRQKIY